VESHKICTGNRLVASDHPPIRPPKERHRLLHSNIAGQNTYMLNQHDTVRDCAFNASADTRVKFGWVKLAQSKCLIV
jgi:hypothetical protein